jgi:arginine decarboxylase
MPPGTEGRPAQPRELDLEPAMLPRAAFAAKETIPASQAAGRIAAEQITPYPPGIPRDHPQ